MQGTKGLWTAQSHIGWWQMVRETHQKYVLTIDLELMQCSHNTNDGVCPSNVIHCNTAFGVIQKVLTKWCETKGCSHIPNQWTALKSLSPVRHTLIQTQRNLTQIHLSNSLWCTILEQNSIKCSIKQIAAKNVQPQSQINSSKTSSGTQPWFKWGKVGVYGTSRKPLAMHQCRFHSAWPGWRGVKNLLTCQWLHLIFHFILHLLVLLP